MPQDDSSAGGTERVGPRGGRTTVSEQFVRKSFLIDHETEALLRAEAHRTRQTEGHIVRTLLQRHFGTAKPDG